ncbi:serine/threonine-protein phosphatase 4 regulatory subunit 1 [Lethenteron reissneri]|uniref:serine/threonine-protein phosphatase 4 regulatory subunit 1 n=1 Tax=Lethenteron reissneri TaxID=7753 RepID=UPI002AB7D975|nr:serine/threonine-protein phosphatase 4 regulatory subunit 1 [Lethenteron reissneri]
MADISLLTDDSEGDPADCFDDFGPDSDIQSITSVLDTITQDEMLTPLARMEKFSSSDNIFNRQMITRSLLDTFRFVMDDENESLKVMRVIVKLSEDAEPTVRAELMEQLPHIAIFCKDSHPTVPHIIQKYLLPVVIRLMADTNNQVRKTSQAALLVLLEQELLDAASIETKVCPVILELTAPESNDDYKAEAVTIMCKMAMVVGKDVTECLLLPRFCELCMDGKIFHVRKVCAAHFGDVCSVVGQKTTEHVLLPKFMQLCSDSVWGVRKACAECFTAVSSTASHDFRRTQLSPLFINLICDPSRWVRMAAFQSLGQFISTFACPPSLLAGVAIHRESKGDVELNIEALSASPSTGAADGQEEPADGCPNPGSDAGGAPAPPPPPPRLAACESGGSESLSADSRQPQPPSIPTERDTHVASEPARSHDDDDEEAAESCRSAESAASERPREQSGDRNSTRRDAEMAGPGGGDAGASDKYGTFLFWRTPLSDVAIDGELLLPLPHPPECHAPREEPAKRDEADGASAPTAEDATDVGKIRDREAVDVAACMLEAASHDSDPSDLGEYEGLHFDNVCLSLDGSVKSSFLNSTEEEEERVGTMDSPDRSMVLTPQPEEQLHNQDVIPQELLDQFLSMTDPFRAQTVDTEIARHCAYSLPGVALTLGTQHWHCLKSTYNSLAADMQWKVRRTLAFSIHELAAILGDRLTAVDLVPVFNGFLKDLDDVRVGVLKHLHDFLKLLPQQKRREYLYHLQEFLVTDNTRNWRFRYDLAEQLILLLGLYASKDVFDHLCPIAFQLCSDKVAEVRWISYKLVSEIVRKLSSSRELLQLFLEQIISKFLAGSKWNSRQTFAYICQAIAEEDCLAWEDFGLLLLPRLLELVPDPVPNVRILLAKTLRQAVLEKDVPAGAALQAAEQAVLLLQSDADPDVRYFATNSVAPNAKHYDDTRSSSSSTY